VVCKFHILITYHNIIQKKKIIKHHKYSEDISVLMNTSPRMVLNVYLGHTDESLIQLHKEYQKD